MQPNIPETEQKRVVIVGAGFGGLALARKLSGKKEVQVVLIDKNNYHQFQPLFYQVATAGLEPSAISFPLRKIFHKKENVHIRVTEVTSINTNENQITTGIGTIGYDYLVLALGADTNFFGLKNIIANAIPMKSVSEALGLRNRLLQNFEDALASSSEEEKEGYMNIVIVGGGPTGTEISGTLAEMRRTVLPKDFPELDFAKMKIYLVEHSPKVLGPMSEQASRKAKIYLENLGVTVMVASEVKDFDGKQVFLGDGTIIKSNILVWTAGIKSNFVEGLPVEVYARAGRIKVDRYNKVEGCSNVYAVGDLALMVEEKYPNGHPQTAQPAIQQGELLAKNLLKDIRHQGKIPFLYKDLGSMATIGRNLAVVDLPYWKFQGFFAWLVWMLVHLMAILGVKNRLIIFINWCWSYITFDQSLRLIIKPKIKKQ
ncbi:MAG TPA: NAD(P)/FAD-dependent oxidoreductase [Cytophagaceae bacterium]|jgi:NADH dehydrogenase|nr:NAD(P)/FAD-dependent oxidoreductase [Cytophagaceae bacterium]